MNTKYTDEQVQIIVHMYSEGKKLSEISDALGGVDKGTISKIAKRNGCKPRILHTNPRKKNERTKKCPLCKTVLPVLANFCLHCGHDVRSEEQGLINLIENMRGQIYKIPIDEKTRKDMDATTRMLLDYLNRRIYT